jgi:hypothetical protein
MFQSINIFARKEQYSAAEPIDQLTVIVEMPARFEGTKVSSRAVMISLLWQQYGLDLLHPEFSRWLEQNARDVKYAVAQNSVPNGVNAGLRVGANGMVKVQLSLEFDRRLREVSSQYIMWQMGPEMEQPEIEQPEMEQEDEIATIVYLNKPAASQKMNSYKLAYVC